MHTKSFNSKETILHVTSVNDESFSCNYIKWGHTNEYVTIKFSDFISKTLKEYWVEIKNA